MPSSPHAAANRSQTTPASTLAFTRTTPLQPPADTPPSAPNALPLTHSCPPSSATSSHPASLLRHLEPPPPHPAPQAHLRNPPLTGASLGRRPLHRRLRLQLCRAVRSTLCLLLLPCRLPRLSLPLAGCRAGVGVVTLQWVEGDGVRIGQSGPAGQRRPPVHRRPAVRHALADGGELVGGDGAHRECAWGRGASGRGQGGTQGVGKVRGEALVGASGLMEGVRAGVSPCAHLKGCHLPHRATSLIPPPRAAAGW